MINLRRLDVIGIFALSAVLLTPAAISWAQQRPPIADKMAKAHGLDSFGQVPLRRERGSRIFAVRVDGEGRQDRGPWL